MVKKQKAETEKSVKIKSEGKKEHKKPETSEKHSEKKIVQPEVNIGLVGHVDHGKTTLTERMTGQWTDTHSEELKRGITIRLGYANTNIYKIKGKGEPECWTTKPEKDAEFTRAVSFVDAPGHESLMATMLAGATIMDGALLLISAKEECPQPQTKEHVVALEIMGIKNIIVVQNKIDLVTEEQAMKNYEQIKEFLKNTPYKDAPIVPVSAQKNVNVDALLDAIQKHIPTPKRDSTKEPLMLVARSFDINKPGSKINNLTGGILGGALIQGEFKINEDIEIKPGRKLEKHGKTIFEPLHTKIVGLKTGKDGIETAKPGGSIGVMTTLDPSIVKSDQLTGSLVGLRGKLPPTWYKLTLEPHLLQRVVGAKEEVVVHPIIRLEPLMLNVNSAATVGIVEDVSKKGVKCTLKLPVCAEIGSKVSISRRVENRFRLIGYGIIKGE
ncbi:translation initiation factor IF-2 subunit gamma [Candidatus Woesearchaeota archaeon]|nr:translation initiation factor IF-2 subunit gamma [Candidatus Woesearchaeota archaeon]